jgi:hypothetical protein
MAISTQTMTPEQMRSVVIEYLERFDRGGDVDPGYSEADTERYHWLREPAEIPA